MFNRIVRLLIHKLLAPCYVIVWRSWNVMIFLIIQGKFRVDVLTRTWFYGKRHSTFPRYKTNDCPNSFDCLLQVMNRSHRSFAMQLRMSLLPRLGLLWLVHTSLMQQPQWIQTLQHCPSSLVMELWITLHSCCSPVVMVLSIAHAPC